MALLRPAAEVPAGVEEAERRAVREDLAGAPGILGVAVAVAVGQSRVEERSDLASRLKAKLVRRIPSGNPRTTSSPKRMKVKTKERLRRRRFRQILPNRLAPRQSRNR